MAKLYQKRVEMVCDGVLPVACLSSGVVLLGVNIISQGPVIHYRKHRAKILNKVDLSKGSGEFGAVVLRKIQLE